MQLHPKQQTIARSAARFKVIRAGRKGGKTAYERESISYKATVKAETLGLAKTVFDTGRKVIYIAPTQVQARKIVWEALKGRLSGIAKFNEQTLEARVPNEDGAWTTIYVGGWENRENYRGLTDVIHITFDETDSLKDFFISWKEIFRPMFLDTKGTADFIGTPNNRNPNLRRLEKEAEGDIAWECFHFTSRDNPHLPVEELDALEKEYDGDRTAYKQEILAEHVDDSGALFRYLSLVDVFTNTVDKTNTKYLIVDIADDGSDKTKFSFWNGLEEYRRESFSRLNTEGVISQIKEYAAEERIPYSNIAVDAVGVGAGVASSSFLDGIVGYKSSYGAMRTDIDPVRLPNVHYTNDAPLITEYRNLRSQCVFTLANLVNNHQIASSIQNTEAKERLIEELALYQDVSTGDGKRMATQKEDIKALLGRSPDDSDTWVMRMYFVLRDKLSPDQSEVRAETISKLKDQFDRNFSRLNKNSSR